MLNQNADLDLLRYLINVIESERNERVYLENRVNTIEKKLNFQVIKSQDFEYQLKDLEGEVAEVRINNQVLSEKNAELENLQHPYSMDGKPICDYWEND
ncbi:hypothetical protein [Hydrocoleum sp. CS-953]|uniref:hypothetical protein n=1 Tax=Microcoleaceae TaxID=1892252 RepID=UPI000B9AA77B|nr:hypothetical protein [Hydrocoleum sp. CS-953]OZH54353.1 hypothetical protein AFK68_11490 [Hydrocoleum sp. CS-953]